MGQDRAVVHQLGQHPYNGVNSFRFTNADGHTEVVRWSMRPLAPFEAMDAEQRKQAGWITSARSSSSAAKGASAVGDVGHHCRRGRCGERSFDSVAGRPPPVKLGTLTLTALQPQAGGACNNLNFDPLILPSGIAGSDDPI